MKRARAYSHAYPSPPNIEEVLDLQGIIRAAAPALLSPYCNEDGSLTQEKIKLEFEIFPDPTMKNKAEPQSMDNNTVFITPAQYQLLISAHSTVLNMRVTEMYFYFTSTEKYSISCMCSSDSFEVMDQGFARWELTFYNPPVEEEN